MAVILSRFISITFFLNLETQLILGETFQNFKTNKLNTSVFPKWNEVK